MGKAFRIGLVVLVSALALTGCGVNGPLEPPGGMTTDENRPSATAPKHHEPFILDGILR